MDSLIRKDYNIIRKTGYRWMQNSLFIIIKKLIID